MWNKRIKLKEEIRQRRNNRENNLHILMRWKKQQNFRKKDWPFAYHTGRGKKKIQVKSLLAGSPSTPAEKAELYNTEKYNYLCIGFFKIH